MLSPRHTNTTRLVVLLASVFPFLTQGCAKPDLKVEARKAIQAGYDAENTAKTKKDLTGALAYHAPDYVTVSKKGTEMGMAAEKKTWAEVFALPATESKYATEIQEITLDNAAGTQATVTAKQRGSCTITNLQTNAQGKMVMDSTVRSFWVKGNSGWRIKREKLLSGEVTINGKSVGRVN